MELTSERKTEAVKRATKVKSVDCVRKRNYYWLRLIPMKKRSKVAPKKSQAENTHRNELKAMLAMRNTSPHSIFLILFIRGWCEFTMKTKSLFKYWWIEVQLPRNWRFKRVIVVFIKFDKFFEGKRFISNYEKYLRRAPISHKHYFTFS